MKKIILASIYTACAVISAVSAPVAPVPVTLATDTYITTETAKKKIFIQIGALESVDGDKYNLRKVSDHLEFYLDDNVKVFQKKQADQNALRQWQYVVVKGPSNGNSVLANSVYVFNDMDSYYETKNDDKDDKKQVVESGLQGTIVRAMSESDEYEKLRNEYGKQQPTPTPVPGADAIAAGDNSEKPIRPFYVKTEDGSIFRILHDDKTYWVYIEKKGKSDIKVGDRLKLYFDKRLTVRYKSYPVKVVIENALGQY